MSEELKPSGVLDSPYGFMTVITSNGTKGFKNGHEVVNGKFKEVDNCQDVPIHWIKDRR